MNRSLCRFGGMCVLVATIAYFSGALFAQKKGGGGSPTPPPPPPVVYSIEVIPAPSTPVYPREVNNLGLVTGNYYLNGEPFAFVFDSRNALQPGTADRFYDLNSLSTLATDLETQLPGWRFSSTYAINDLGQIAGVLRDSALANRRGYVIDTHLQSDPDTWSLIILPDFGSSDSAATDINELGEVVGHYQRTDGTQDFFLVHPWIESTPIQLGLNTVGPGILNNQSQIAGELLVGNSAFVFDAVTDTIETYAISSYFQLHGFNDDAVFCGVAELKLGGKGSIKRLPFRYDAINGQSPVPVSDGGYPCLVSGTEGINSAGDLSFVRYYYDSTPQKACLSYSGSGTTPSRVWNLNDLIEGADPLRTDWLVNHQDINGMSDRDSTGFPTLTARLWLPGGVVGVVLTPQNPN